MLFFWVCFGLFNLCLMAGFEAKENRRIKRTADPSFDTVKGGDLTSFTIGGCNFEKDGTGCDLTYLVNSGTCNINTVITHLFPGVSLQELTSDFINPDNFLAQRIIVNKCEGNKKYENVMFRSASTASVELIPQHMTLAAETTLDVRWRYDDEVVPEKLALTLRGLTTVGDNHDITLQLKKSDVLDYDIKFTMGSLNVATFLAKFGLTPADLINSELTSEIRALGLSTLTMGNPKVTGVFSVGGGFEIIAKGTINAPQLASEADKFYLIIQNFKEANNDPQITFAKPVAAIFAVFKDTTVQDVIEGVSGVALSNFALFRSVTEVVVTAASKEIYNINTEELRKLTEKYVPIEGLDMIQKGLSVMHYSPNSNSDIKDKQEQTADRVLFRCDFTTEKLTWISPQVIQTPLENMARLVWTNQKGLDDLKVPRTTPGLFVNIGFVKDTRAVSVSFNLTEAVPVLQDRTVSLTKTTITLTSERTSGNYQHWKITGKGEETILDELVEVTVEQGDRRTTVTADTKIYDMNTLRNRTSAEPLDDDLAQTFKFAMNLPFSSLRFEASFEWSKVLKIKGSALLPGYSKVEIHYYLPGGNPALKVGIQFKSKLLHEAMNMFYEEEMMKSTWMKFKNIGIVMKKQQPSGSDTTTFDIDILERADATFSNGVGFVAETIDLTSCRNTGWKMCDFLDLHHEDTVDLNYAGKITEDKVRMSVETSSFGFWLGNGIGFGGFMNSHLTAKKGGDRLIFDGLFSFSRTFESFPGKIYDDGTNKLLIKFSSEGNAEFADMPESFRRARPEWTTKMFGNINFVKAQPIKAEWEIPSTEKLLRVDLRCRLHIGTVQEEAIQFSGSKSRQYVYSPSNAEPYYQFTGEGDPMRYDKITTAFNALPPDPLLHNARFKSAVVVGYNSHDDVWEVKEYNLKIKKGLHFFGKLTLKTDETYKSTVNLLDNMQLETRLEMPPLRYGKSMTDSDGKPNFESVNLFLYNLKRPEQGPTLVLGDQVRRFEGYCETIGLAGSFTTEIEQGEGEKYYYKFKLNGHLYKEVEGAEVTLKTEGKDNPQDFSFSYQVDLQAQAQGNIMQSLRNALSDAKTQASTGKEKAATKLSETTQLLEHYRTERQRHQDEMTSAQDQIQTINSQIDASVLDISTDCIDTCRTVSMPGIAWQQDCVDTEGQNNVKCMEWSEDREKVVNVICLLKCEAKKVGAASNAADNLQEIRVLLNRYKESKILEENVGKMVALAQEAVDVATDTKTLIDGKAAIDTELTSLLSQANSANLVQISSLSVDGEINDLLPPCLPFQLGFTLNTQPPITKNGQHDICFNGEFYMNVAKQILRSSYPSIDELYTALEEAEMRYIRIAVIKKSLTRVNDDITKETSSKRGHIARPEHGIVERRLLKTAERKMPAFTTKGDHTVMAFTHYSPWATARRSNPFASVGGAGQKKFNFASLKDQTHCQQAKQIISEYRDITHGLNKISQNYQRGKILFDKKKGSIEKDLESSYRDITRMINKTKASPYEQRDMLFWYQNTREGMNDYLNTFAGRLSEHNKRGLTFFKDDLSAYYGEQDFFGALHELGHTAYTRSNVPAVHKDKHNHDFKKVGKELQRLLYTKEITVEDASASLAKLNKHVEKLYHSAVACY